MPIDEHHAVIGELVGHRHRLFRVAGVVAHLELQLLAKDAAGGIDVIDRLLGAQLHLRAERGVLAGDRAGGGDLDLRLRGRRGQQACHSQRGGAGQQSTLHHDGFPRLCLTVP